MADDSVLFTLKIDGAGTAGVVEQVTSALKELVKTKAELTEADAANEKQIKATEEAIKKQEEQIEKTKKAIEAEEGSIAKLREENKKLTAQRNATSASTEEGRKKIKQLNEQIEKNNSTIRDNIDATTKQRMSIDRTITNLDALNIGYVQSAQGIWGMTKASLAFIATPLGIVLAALGAILLTVTSYFKSSEEGGDKWAKVMAQASAVIGVLTDRLIQVGDAIVSFFSGDWDEAAEKLTGAFKGIGDEMEREKKLAGELSDMLDAIEEKELANAIAISTTANEIKRLLIQAKDRNISEQERIRLLDKALELEKEQAAQSEAIAKEKLLASALQLQMDFSQFEAARKNGESELAFAQRLLGNEKISMERRQETAKLLVDYNQLVGESLVVQEKLIVKKNEAAQRSVEDAEREKKAQEELAKAEWERLSDQEKMNRQAQKNEEEQFAQMKANDEAELTAQQEASTRSVEISVEEARAKQKLLDDQHAAELAAIEQRKQLLIESSQAALNILAMNSQTQQMIATAEISKIKAAEQQKLDALQKRFKSGLISEAAYNAEREEIQADAKAKEVAEKKKAFEAEKKNRIAQTIATTVQSAVNAFNSFAGLGPVGIALGIAAAAAATVFGFKQVKAIKETQFTGFAKGGLTGTRINHNHGLPISRTNGDNLLATVRTGEVILNERQQAALGGANTFRAIGVPGFAAGGFTGASSYNATLTADRQNSIERSIERLTEETAKMKIVLYREHFQEVEGAVQSVQMKATVL